MAISPERKPRINPDLDPEIRQNINDPISPNIHVTQTDFPSQPSGSSAGGYLIAAVIVLLGFALAIYFGSRTDTTAPTVTQTQTAPEAPAPATPPAATTEPVQPVTPAQPETTTQQPATGTGTSGTTTSP